VHTLLVEVDPRGEIAELDEENNRRTIEVWVSGDGGGVPWYWIIPILLIGFGGVELRRWLNRPKRFQIKPQKDIGTQEIEPGTPTQPDFEIRLRPVLDPGKQDIEVAGSLIISEGKEEHE
jgi:hypothetical protein